MLDDALWKLKCRVEGGQSLESTPWRIRQVQHWPRLLKSLWLLAFPAQSCQGVTLLLIFLFVGPEISKIDSEAFIGKLLCKLFWSHAGSNLLE